MLKLRQHLKPESRIRISESRIQNPESGFWFSVSCFQIPDSGFRLLVLPPKLHR